MKTKELIKYELLLHTLDRTDECLQAALQRIESLEKHLASTVDELQDWWDDQGDYGADGYEKWMPELRKVIEDKEL